MGTPRTPKGRARAVAVLLAGEYTGRLCELDHSNAFELLVATILSAQTTDERVNMVTPALFAKYLNAAKALADHAVLLPDGFRFSPATTRRDWTDEATAALRRFYAGVAPPVVLESTHARALEWISLDDLRAHQARP